MRIAIYGLAKTGTTALYYKIKSAMPRNTACYFEPGLHRQPRIRRQELLARIGIGRSRPLLVKFLPFRPGAAAMLDRFGAFDRSILITRDPRDRLISVLLYRPYESQIARRPAAVREWVALLQAKEGDPRSVSLMRLLCSFCELQGERFDQKEWVADYAGKAIAEPLQFAAEHPELFQFRYEDLVDRNFAGLGDYLGLPLEGEAVVADVVRRVVRTRAYGGWRDWFSPDDVIALRPVLQPYLDRYYPTADWSLEPTPSIDPAHGSRYVMRIVDERRAASWLPKIDYREGGT